MALRSTLLGSKTSKIELLGTDPSENTKEANASSFAGVNNESALVPSSWLIMQRHASCAQWRINFEIHICNLSCVSLHGTSSKWPKFLLLIFNKELSAENVDHSCFEKWRQYRKAYANVCKKCGKWLCIPGLDLTGGCWPSLINLSTQSTKAFYLEKLSMRHWECVHVNLCWET